MTGTGERRRYELERLETEDFFAKEEMDEMIPGIY